MSGHSKWSTIKRKKEKTDGQKAKIFTKIGKEIMVCVKEGGGDPEVNGKLKDLISKAKQNNVPNDNIDRIIKKAQGSSEKDNYEAVLYEGYGPNGVAVIVEGLTDNKNRTAADVRHFFDKFGGNLGTTGCVSFMFSRQGIIVISGETLDEDKLLEDSIEYGADDVEFNSDTSEDMQTAVTAVISTSTDAFNDVHHALENAGYSIESAQIEQVPATYTVLTDPESIIKMNKLIEHLEDNDDVLQIWHNWEDNGEAE